MYNGQDSLPNSAMLFTERHKSFQSPDEPFHALEPHGQATAAQARAARRGVTLTACATTTLIVGSLFAMIGVLLSYLCAVNQCQLSKHSIISTAPLGKVLTITQVTSHISPISIPIVMGLFSYLLSAKWLRSSGQNRGPDQPTPMQLGLLMSMCNAANLTAFFSSAKFMATKGDKLTPAPMLRRSIFVLGSLLAVSYIVAAADAWLHASSTGIVIPSISAYTGSALPQFGREINETMCQEASVFDTDAVGHITAASCGILNPGSGGSGNKLAEGIRVLSNSSTLQRVVFTDDQTALLVPQNLPSNITYEAQAVGVKSQCTSITKYCIYITSDYGPNAFLNLDCSKGGINYQNSSAQTQIPPLCALDGQGVCTIGIDIPSNPFTAAEVVTSFAYLNPGQPLDQFIGNTGWFVHGNKGAWNVVFCNITALDVTYTYTSSQFVVHKAVPKSVTDTQHIMAAGFEGQTTAISQQVDGAGSDPNTGTYEQAYALELSRQMLARGAFLYEPNDVIRIQSKKSIIGSNLQVAPLVLFVAALVLFSLQVLWITLRIIIAAWNVQFVELAALFLSNPLTVVQMLYGQPNPELTWNKNVEQRFKDETDLDRLQVGPVYTEQGSFFTVTKASV